MVRFVLAFCVFAGLLIGALVFEAAARTEIAREAIAAAPSLAGSPQHDEVLARAVQQLETSWAQPARWHAGAANALSALYALQAEAAGGDRELFAKSVAAAVTSVRLAPVQPLTWTRLAAFAQMGLADVPCSVEHCLDMSWRAARMIDPRNACTRLRIAHAEGLLTGPDDVRIRWYAQSGASAQEIAHCLDFMPREPLFRSLLEAR
jgi:hypothetical protein